jgi:hypothetical protein
MSAIQTGTIAFTNVFQYDMFDNTFDIEGIDLTGKTLLCQVKESPDSAVALEFNEDDGSLTKTVVSSTKTTVTFYKDSQDMDIPPLFEKGSSSISYYLTIVMFTDDADIGDVQTIVEGSMEIVPQITLLS